MLSDARRMQSENPACGGKYYKTNYPVSSTSKLQGKKKEEETYRLKRLGDSHL